MSMKLSTRVMNTVKHSSPQSICNKLLASHNELRFNIDLQPGPIVGAHCPFLEPTLSQKVSPTAAKRHACTLLPIPLQSPIAVPLQPDLQSLLPLALPSHDIAP